MKQYVLTTVATNLETLEIEKIATIRSEEEMQDLHVRMPRKVGKSCVSVSYILSKTNKHILIVSTRIK